MASLAQAKSHSESLLTPRRASMFAYLQYAYVRGGPLCLSLAVDADVCVCRPNQFSHNDPGRLVLAIRDIATKLVLFFIGGTFLSDAINCALSVV